MNTPSPGRGGMHAHEQYLPADEFEVKLEQMFEQADNLLINECNYHQAVSVEYFLDLI